MPNPLLIFSYFGKDPGRAKPTADTISWTQNSPIDNF